MTVGEFLFKDGRKFLVYLTVDEWSYKRKSGVSIHLKGSKIASFDQVIFFESVPTAELQNLTDALGWSEER